MSRAQAVEAAAIRVATEYAAENGYSSDNRTAIGLVLAGMAIGAAAEQPARVELVAGYGRAFPAALVRVVGWARSLNTAAEREARDAD